ncbi:phosphatidate cytidylyltransferase [Desulfonatronum thiosulfatophilum]|uniref:Phosphatidate cytidylyltransferase n=1 Tax=Desulfonatronum thiosulfatophilum TaxID=617002 RepID=A0A1G6C7H3_9BACT|nr:phosphatidate cytidylyltransferase [Desulfonatronum thiosulfatophilum]SDB28762.1 phosphatidate cytidylyltransferase [Desulfonatronum thiosulfatophilum]
MTLTSHQKRLLTALLPLPLLLWVLYAGGWPLLLLVIVLSALGQWEFYAMFWQKEQLANKFFGIAAGSIFLLGVFLSPAAAPILLAVFFCLSGVLFVSTYAGAPDSTRYQDAQILFLGVCYLPLLLHFALALPWPALLLVVAAAFISDTGAYYAGSMWGRRHVWPAISPKKTWMGSAGGMTACILSTVIIGLIWGTAGVPALVLLGVVLNVASQFGDFFESALKRSRAIKDSGALLPGHGGVLDRIDSLLFALPAYAALSYLHPFFG